MDGEDAGMLTAAIERVPLAVVLTDARLDDNPITYVNDAFEALTGYSREYALGRNCRFLQGAGTEAEVVAEMRDKLQAGEEFSVTVTNHRADGEPFRNRILIAPVTDEGGDVAGFLGLLREVDPEENTGRVPDRSLQMLHELQHRVKNHLAMVVSMIRLQASRDVTRASFDALGRRVEALALLYDEMFAAAHAAEGKGSDTIRTGAYLSRVARTVSNLADAAAIRLNTDCADVDLPVDQAGRLGLLMSELLTNALEHAFVGRASGCVTVSFAKRDDDGGVRLIIQDDGIGLSADGSWPSSAPSVQQQVERAGTGEGALNTRGEGGHSGTGGSIVLILTEMLGAYLEVQRGGQGTRIVVDFDAGG